MRNIFMWSEHDFNWNTLTITNGHEASTKKGEFDFLKRPSLKCIIFSSRAGELSILHINEIAGSISQQKIFGKLHLDQDRVDESSRYYIMEVI